MTRNQCLIARQLSLSSNQQIPVFRIHQMCHFRANMFVEDAVSAQGPIVVEVNPTITVADLKLQIEAEFEIPVNVQKWILGKNLVSDNNVVKLRFQSLFAFCYCRLLIFHNLSK